MFLPRKILEEKIRNMLAEDLGQGDVTTALVVPADSTAEAEVIAKEAGVIAGMEEAKILLESLGLKAEISVSDGEKVKAKSVLMKISGDTRTMLSVERTLLNIISRMSGIATTTRKLRGKIRKAKLKTRVACTRKVAPGLLYFDKKAVLIGGGDTHRLHLDDMILIKDNHIIVAGSIKKAIEKVRKDASFSKKIEVEVTRVNDVLAAARARVDIIMLDNFTPKRIEEAIRLLKKERLFGKVLLEASGGITSENILAYASTGVDIISLGEITHSAKALDISLEITKARPLSRQDGT
ncbi:MAG: carboxylating nicotinate-nucleotide diphosphorylase [Candidatus Bathyarchaeota archaeon]|nr:carboxylating nicotinate-nucleotide diphosphorylase [Candidatus Bathyarchaeota archaeon]